LGYISSKSSDIRHRSQNIFEHFATFFKKYKNFAKIFLNIESKTQNEGKISALKLLYLKNYLFQLFAYKNLICKISHSEIKLKLIKCIFGKDHVEENKFDFNW
jgi:hypothetical protein